MATKNTRRTVKPSYAAAMAVGLFALTWRILEMIAADPKLADNQLFSMLAQGIVLSGLIGGAATLAFNMGVSAKKDEGSS